MRTRCPRCQTVFRITPEQLRARAGKVRCGHCQSVFNALETLIEEPPAFDVPAPDTESPKPEPVPAPESAPAPTWEPQPEPAPEPEGEREAEPVPLPEPMAEATSEIAPVTEPETSLEFAAEPSIEPTEPEAIPAVADVSAYEPPREETPEETTLAAREAGLVAARELAETPGYNRWAAAPLAGLESEPAQAKWPFVLAALILALALALQLAYHFRTELTRRLPSLESVYSAVGVEVPLPRQVDLVSIETSDLQSDNARSLLVLQATLKNRAAYDQAWPALELALTDTHDAVIARRVLEAADYLPPKTDPAAFPANSETSLRLWIEAKEVAAAGYRLYVFYP